MPTNKSSVAGVVDGARAGTDGTRYGATTWPAAPAATAPCMACMQGVDAAGGMATEARAAAARSPGDDRAPTSYRHLSLPNLSLFLPRIATGRTVPLS